MQLVNRFSFPPILLLPLILLLLLQVSPVSQEVQRRLAQAERAKAQGQYLAAAEAWREALRREPWRTSLWEEIGRAAFMAGRSEQAVQAFEAAKAAGRLSPQGKQLLAEAYLLERSIGEAKAVLQALLQEHGPDSHLYQRLAALQRAERDYPAAVATLRAWWDSPVRSPQAAYLLGLHLCAVRPEEALPLLQEAQAGDRAYAGAVQVLRRGLAQASSASDQPAYGWVMIGRALASAGAWDLAEEAFWKAAAEDAQYAEAWAFLSVAQMQNGATGAEAMARATQLAPDSTVVNALAAYTLRRQGMYAEAVQALEKIAAQEPGEPAWQLEIAETLAAYGDIPRARTYFDRAAALDTHTGKYWQALTRFSVQYSIDLRGWGLPAARRAMLLAPKDPGSLDAMGWLLAHLGDAATAERFLQQALDRDAGFPLANLHLGQLRLQQERPAEAYFLLLRAARQESDLAVRDLARRLLRQYYGEEG
jgi:predicted Zn-dependent protease